MKSKLQVKVLEISAVFKRNWASQNGGVVLNIDDAGKIFNKISFNDFSNRLRM